MFLNEIAFAPNSSNKSDVISTINPFKKPKNALKVKLLKFIKL